MRLMQNILHKEDDTEFEIDYVEEEDEYITDDTVETAEKSMADEYIINDDVVRWVLWYCAII